MLVVFPPTDTPVGCMQLAEALKRVKDRAEDSDSEAESVDEEFEARFQATRRLSAVLVAFPVRSSAHFQTIAHSFDALPIEPGVYYAVQSSRNSLLSVCWSLFAQYTALCCAAPVTSTEGYSCDTDGDVGHRGAPSVTFGIPRGNEESDTETFETDKGLLAQWLRLNSRMFRCDLVSVLVDGSDGDKVSLVAAADAPPDRIESFDSSAGSVEKQELDSHARAAMVVYVDKKGTYRGLTFVVSDDTGLPSPRSVMHGSTLEALLAHPQGIWKDAKAFFTAAARMRK